MPDRSASTDHHRHELRRLVLQAVRQYWRSAHALYPAALADTVLPAIRFDLRGSSAGQVEFTRRLQQLRPCAIRFNLAIAERNTATYIHRTVAHEIAHVVAVIMHGRRGLGHGRHWQRIMADFGQPAERCHQYDLDGIPIRRQRRFNYQCQCPDEQQLSAVRHFRQQRGERLYYCKRCRTSLRFTGPAEQPIL